jgi:hypothetical protein
MTTATQHLGQALSDAGVVLDDEDHGHGGAG